VPSLPLHLPTWQEAIGRDTDRKKAARILPHA